MISQKGKRKIVIGEKTYFWWIKKDGSGHPKINILSEDKAVFIKTGYDRELCIGPGYIRELIEKKERAKE
ncbi:MAG: hypothetical protein IJA20_03660 [Methanocorpusculum sp.]|nr:hypothetical protein [Oscillospiraceae bacterium]MBQ3569754.1 hypothetical protein [Methanocorpusculum sp.]